MRQTDQHESGQSDAGQLAPEPCFLATPGLWVRVQALSQALETDLTLGPLGWPDCLHLRAHGVCISVFSHPTGVQGEGRLLLEILVQDVPEICGTRIIETYSRKDLPLNKSVNIDGEIEPQGE